MVLVLEWLLLLLSLVPLMSGLFLLLLLFGLLLSTVTVKHASVKWPFSQCTPCIVFEWPPVLLLHNVLNLDRCQSKVFKCLNSLPVFMKVVHSCTVSLSNLFSRRFLHVSLWKVNMVIELLMDLILSLSKALSALLIIYFPLGVLILLLSLTLTGIMSLLRHLREKCLWF